MVFSKLAFSSSLLVCQPSSRVTMAQSTTTTRRWLNRLRSSSEPERGSKSLVAPVRSIGELFTANLLVSAR
ncbi:hypothetical protein D3C84_1039040 [compost metagenome]